MKLKHQMEKSESMHCLSPKSPSAQKGEHFSRINPTKITNNEGKSAIVLFKKRIKVPTIFDLVLRDTGYLSDGGMKKKLQRFQANRTYSKAGIAMIVSPRVKQAKRVNTPLMSKSVLNHSMKEIKPKHIRDYQASRLLSPQAKNNRSCFVNKSSLLKKHSRKSSCDDEGSVTPQQRRCLSPEVKMAKMEELIEKAFKSKVRECTGEKPKKTRQEELKERKQKYLMDNGIALDDKGDYTNDGSKDTAEEEKHNKHKKNTLLKSKLLPTSKEGNEDSHHERKILKPKIDQFEYMKKINSEIKRISHHFQSNSQKSLNLNSSFRKTLKSEKAICNGIDNLNGIDLNINNIRRKKDNSLDSRYFNAFSNSHNYSVRELASFTLTKRLIQKEKEDQTLLQKSKKLFLIYKNLFNLTQKLQFRPKRKPKIITPKHSLDLSSGNNQSANQYAISTVFDRDDYYDSVLQSKKVLKKTPSDFEQQRKKQKALNTNPLTPHFLFIPKLKSKVNNYIDIDSITNDQSTAQFSELQQKAIQTILRTNHLLSKENFDQLLSLDKKTNSSFQNNLLSNRKNNESYTEQFKCDSGIKAELNDIEENKVVKTPLSKLVISIETNPTHINETKDGNMPSLPHEYTINNTIANNKRIIEPRMVLNLVMIVKLIIQRRIFYLFYEDYFNESMIQRYTISFIYFNALIKQRTFHLIACYANAKLEYFAISQLFKPFIKSCFGEFLQKLQHLQLLQKESMDKLALYQHSFDRLYELFTTSLIRPPLKEAFEDFTRRVNEGEDSWKTKNERNKEVPREERLATVSSSASIEKDERRYIKYKMNTYAYESFSMKSEYVVESNSVDSDKLHRLNMIMEQNGLMLNQGLMFNQGLMLESDLNDNQSKYHSTNNRVDSNSKSNYSPHSSHSNVRNTKDLSKLKLKSSFDLSRSNESIKDLSQKLLRKKEPSSSNNSSDSKKQKGNASPLNRSKEEDNELNTSRNIKSKREEEEEEMKYKRQEDKHAAIKEKEDDKESCHSQRKIRDNANEKGNAIQISWKDKQLITSEEDVLAEEDHAANIEWSNVVNMSKDKEDIVTKEKKGAIEKAALSFEGKVNTKANTRYEEEENMELVKEVIKEAVLPKSLMPALKIPDETNIKEGLTSSLNDSMKQIKRGEEPGSSRILSALKEEEILIPDNLNTLINEIISELIQSEIVLSPSILPIKNTKYELISLPVNYSNSLSSSTSQGLLSLTQQIDNFPFMNYTALSIFFKTIKDKKKDHAINYYLSHIFPTLLLCIKAEISRSYSRIYHNLVIPIKSNPEGLMASLTLEDADMLRENYKRLILREEDFEVLKRDRILKHFNLIKGAEVKADSINTLISECVIDTVIELLNSKRLYGDIGEPLPWGSRNRQLVFSYPKDDPSKLCIDIEKEVVSLIDLKLGIISDNNEAIDHEILNIEREKRLITNILNELNEEDEHWTNLEMEETQVKLELNEIILDHLYNEIIEIIEHITHSRANPALYRYKSIYSCEEVPKLSIEVPSLIRENR